MHPLVLGLVVPFVLLNATPVLAASASLRLEFQPRSEDQPITLPADVGGLTVTRLDWLVSGLALQRKDGSWMNGRDWFGYLSGAERRLSVDADGVLAGDFTAIRFRVGLDAETDAADPARWGPDHALHPGVNHLHWGWQNGYVFLALEGRTPAKGGFSYHLARQEEPMTVEIPVEFRGGGPVTISIAFDVAKLLEGVDLSRDESSTHSRPADALAVRLKKRAAGAFRVVKVSNDIFQPVTPNRGEAIPPPPGTHPLRLDVTQRFPQVNLPAGNPLTTEGVALGRRLFHEKMLSGNGAQACASCHEQVNAFADARRFSVGSEGQPGKRNAMPLFNLAWNNAFFWDGRAKTLREQVLMPVTDAHEMNQRLDLAVEKLNADKSYRTEFAAAFGSAGITSERLAMALEQFLLTLVSQESKFDRAVRKLTDLAEDEKRGLQLFVTEFDPKRGLRGADCFHCHGGTLFTDHQFHNNGLPLDDADIGRMAVTGAAADRGKFKAPSLRNIARTAPYMHDGRFAALEDVIEHYSSGVQRSETLDPNLAKHPAAGIELTAEQKHDLVAFLKTLTDEPFTQNSTPLTQNRLP